MKRDRWKYILEKTEQRPESNMDTGQGSQEPPEAERYRFQDSHLEPQENRLISDF